MDAPHKKHAAKEREERIALVQGQTKEAKLLKKGLAQYLEDSYKLVWKEYNTLKTQVIEMEYLEKNHKLPLIDEPRLKEKKRKLIEFRNTLRRLSEHYNDIESASPAKISEKKEQYREFMEKQLPSELPKEFQGRVVVEAAIKPIADIMLVSIIFFTALSGLYVGPTAAAVVFIVLILFYIVFVSRSNWQKRLAKA